MLQFLTNSPRAPIQEVLPDMCETCESSRRDDKFGHDTWLAVVPGMTDGTLLWFCSMTCLRMSPVPTLDDNREPGEPWLKR